MKEFMRRVASCRRSSKPSHVIGASGRTVEIDLYGKRLSVFQDERRGAKLIEAQQGLQAHLIDVLLNLSQAQEFDYFLDVGANYGEFTCAIGKRVPRHILFEPHPDLAALLVKNFATDDYVTIENVAISNYGGTKRLYFREGYLGASSLSSVYLESLPAKQWGFRSPTRTVRVASRTLDAYKDQIRNGSNLLIKIDVEGYEREVIAGLGELLRTTSHWIVLLEFNPLTLDLLHEDGSRRLWNDLPSRRGIVIAAGEWPTGTIKDWEVSHLPEEPPDRNCDILLFKSPRSHVQRNPF
jgi:FkbM family methyltransferase